jgi:4-amino-4-deoxy-L-arabinose transferase-like glycosyltransferase
LPDAILSPHLKSATPINREHATKVGLRNYALVFFGCVLFHLAGMWSLPLIDRDEPRFAEASREMIERGDYVVPYFNNRVRFDKPPLTYWAQVASYKVFGENDFAARFPSAIAAALTAVLLLVWGSRLGKTSVGWWAAIIFTLSLQTFVHAKAAVADMWLVLFVTLAHWAGYELLRDRLANESKRPTLNPPSQDYGAASVQPAFARLRRGKRPTSNSGWWWIFYFALAFAFLAKGPIGWTPLLTVTSTIILLREPQLAQRFKFGRGIVLILAVVALWGIPALIQTHGEFLTIGIGRHVIGRSFGAMEGHGANSLGAYLLLLPFYFVTIFASFFPWSIKLPWLMRKLWRKQEAGVIRLRQGYGGQADRGYSTRDAMDNYLIVGSAIIFFIFTLVKTKLPHYTLPAFPLLSLLLARHWLEQGTALTQVPTAAERRRSLFKCTAMTSACLYLVLALFVAPFAARYFPAWQLYRASREYLRPEMQFGAVDYNEPSLVWYFRSPESVRGWLATPALHPASVQRFMEQTGPRFVILPIELAGKIYPALPNDWKDFRARGFNLVKGKRVDLTLILKTE